MRRALLVFALCLAFPAGAQAAIVVCPGGKCTGTTDPDLMFGSAKHDLIYALAGNDTIKAGVPLISGLFSNDADVIHAGSGDDTIDVFDHVSTGESPGAPGADTVYCGKGDDTVTADKNDKLHGCEHVTRS